MPHRPRSLRAWSAIPAAALALGACATAGGEPSAGLNIPAMAATYRHIFENNASGLKSNAATYCVGIGARPGLADPPPALIAALADVRPQVQPASSCRFDAQAVNATGRPSLIFNLEQVRCYAPTDCLFQGGYYEANLSASAGRYRARLVDGRWQVRPVGPQAVS